MFEAALEKASLFVSKAQESHYVIFELCGKSAHTAMEEFQYAMTGEAERAGLTSEEDVIALCKQVRRESIY